ncbi:MerR family DNA-binding transcriptional regulator, partial [Lactobacillus sp. XV13L]|nr:MerR family DNA-binding transcriptional regulator [Lactobacillus sp. XV13L]
MKSSRREQRIMKISDVAEKVNLTPVTLRYYERMGLL